MFKHNIILYSGVSKIMMMDDVITIHMFEGKDTDNDGQEYDESNKWNLIVITCWFHFSLLLLLVGLCFTACKQMNEKISPIDAYAWVMYLPTYKVC